jgi:hypothetical protein
MPNDANDDFVTAVRDRPRDRYFLFASATLLFLLIVGFSPTLFLKTFFDTPELPIYLHVHGAVVTLWFVWLLSQASLVALNRTDLHRRLGKFAAIFGIAVVPAGLMATLGIIPRARSTGVDIEANIEIFSSIVWGNLSSLLAFSGFLVFAIYFRKRADIHKRLMLLASLVIMGPVFARISFWPVFSSVGEIPFIISAILLMLGTLFVHDFIQLRRIHPATVIGGSCFFLSIILSQLLSNTEIARNFVHGL